MKSPEIIGINDFNPHSHKGSDNENGGNFLLLPISIHTPTRGVTAWYSRQIDLMNISIHTPTRGVTLAVPYPVNENGDFNPHSHKGSDERNTELVKM